MSGNTQACGCDLMNHPERRLRISEVKLMTGFSADSSIYRLISKGKFPKPFKVGERAVAWRLGEILDYLAGNERADVMEVDDEQG